MKTIITMEAVGPSHTRHGMQARLPEYNRRHGTQLSGRPVSGTHRKPCSDCDMKFEFDGWYWTDHVSPWGADKFCDNCMAQKLGGWLQDEFGDCEDEFEGDYEDY